MPAWPTEKHSLPVAGEAKAATLSPHGQGVYPSSRPVTGNGGDPQSSSRPDPSCENANPPPTSHLQPTSQVKPETLIHIKCSLEVRAELCLLYKERKKKKVPNELRNGASVSSKG